MFSSFGQRINPSLTDVVYRRRTGMAGDPAVLKCSGLNGNPINEQRNPELETLTGRGFTVLHGTWSSASHFGNDAAQNEALSGITFIQATPWSASAGKVGIIGGSMGGLLALLLVVNNPSLFFGFAVGIPAVSLIDIHDNNRITNAATIIESAYGGSAGWNAAKASHDPLTRAAEFQQAGMPPGKIWYSNNDPVCIPSLIEQFASTSGIPAVNMGDQTNGPSGYEGHGVYANYPGEIADFLANSVS